MNLMKSIMACTIPEGQMGIWWVGQSGFFIKLANQQIILMDAYLSNSIAEKNAELVRKIPPPIDPSEVKCDYYICTHNHLDHTDSATIKNLKNKESIKFIGPRNTVEKYIELEVPSENIVLLEAGSELEMDGFTLTGTFCIPNDDRVLDSIGVVLSDKEGITLYHTGDTAYHQFLDYVKKFSIDIMITCINGKYGNMGMKDAMKLTAAISPNWVIPCHFDMFEINSADPYKFRQMCLTDKLSAECVISQIGKCVTYSKGLKV